MAPSKNRRYLLTELLPVVVTIVLATIINEYVEYSFDYDWPFVLTIMLYLTVFLLTNRIVKFLMGTEEIEVETHPGVNWPLSGPAGRAGNAVVLMMFVPSSLLTLLNPLQLLHNLRPSASRHMCLRSAGDFGRLDAWPKPSVFAFTCLLD